MACFILRCNGHSRRYKHADFSEHISMHRMPTDPKTKVKWLAVIPRAGNSWTKHSRICSRHFTDDCFDTKEKWRKLKPDAVPSLFTRSAHVESSFQVDFKLKTWNVPIMAEYPKKESFDQDSTCQTDIEREVEAIQDVSEIVKEESFDQDSTCQIDIEREVEPIQDVSEIVKEETTFILPTHQIPDETPTRISQCPPQGNDKKFPLRPQGVHVAAAPSMTPKCCALLKKRVLRLEKQLARTKEISHLRLLKFHMWRQRARRLNVKNQDLKVLINKILEKDDPQRF